MAKYRPVDQRLWSDRKFLSLGDDARLLWTFLLTSPRALPIPGVIVAGQAAMAEYLGWSVERFDKRFREVQQSGLAVSREGTLVWLRNATKYQPPANPNMVIGWSKVWDDVPECNLKHEIWEALKIACKGWNRIFEKRFTEPLLEPFQSCSADGYAQEQEQEQEHKQEQDQEQDLVPPSADNPNETQLGRLKRKVNRTTPKLPRKHPLPADWAPSAAHAALAAELGINVTVQAEKFRDHHTAKGTRFVDWEAAFRNWLRNANEWSRKPATDGLQYALDVANGVIP